MDYAKESLRLHGEWKGKIEVTARVPVETKDDLSLAYTPGVAQPCLEIQKDLEKSYELTRRWNLCAVITDGSAVLGLGDIGPEAGMPVMEGKCVLFKAFGDVDAFPLQPKRCTLRENLSVLAALCRSTASVPALVQAVESGGVPVHLLLKCGECVLLLVNDSQYEQALRAAYAASRQLRD